jgi:L,D-transpeptidase catalytic domain
MKSGVPSNHPSPSSDDLAVSRRPQLRAGRRTVRAGFFMLGGTLGTAASHGCVRLGTGSIDWLASHIEPGTPVTINPGAG